MLRFQRESKIKIGKNEYVVSSLLETLINYPAKDVVDFFSEINLSFPRFLRIGVLREVLRPEVLKTRIKRASLADEMNYRLSWFNQFTEVQLNNLFIFYKDPILEKNYYEELWIEMINYITEKAISENDFLNLINLSVEHSKRAGVKLADANMYNNALNPLFYDEKGRLDGLKQDIIRPVLYKSSTITEIRELGLKYNVNVPKRLKKSELMDIILTELRDRGEYTEDKESELLNMNILVMQRYAIKQGIKASTELKKEEVIEYILSNAEETKETYFIPSSSVYEIEAHEVGDAMPEVEVQPVEEEPKPEVVEEVIVEEEVIEEPVVEETPEEVVEEPVQEEVVVQTVTKEVTHVVHETKEKDKFDYTFIEETHLNTMDYSGHKHKKFAKNLNSLKTADLEADESVFKVELMPVEEEKTKFTLGKFLLKLLLNIIIILVVIFIIIVIYAGITYKGQPTQSIFKSFENFIHKVYKAITSSNVYPVQGIRNWIIKLLKLTV